MDTSLKQQSARAWMALGETQIARKQGLAALALEARESIKAQGTLWIVLHNFAEHALAHSKARTQVHTDDLGWLSWRAMRSCLHMQAPAANFLACFLTALHRDLIKHAKAQTKLQILGVSIDLDQTTNKPGETK